MNKNIVADSTFYSCCFCDIRRSDILFHFLLQDAQYLEREEVPYSVLDSLKNVAEQLDTGLNVV